jgi:hypothetical protein
MYNLAKQMAMTDKLMHSSQYFPRAAIKHFMKSDGINQS